MKDYQDDQIVPDDDDVYQGDDLNPLAPKESVNYRYSSDPRISCQYCVHYEPNDAELYDGGACSVTEGAIRAVDVCDEFSPKSGKMPAPLPAGSLPGGMSEARRKFAESYGEDDSKFPMPVDPWTTSEGEGHAHQHAAAAVEALWENGWRQSGPSALRWRNDKLSGHAIEIVDDHWTHSVENVIQHQGPHRQLAAHVKAVTGIYKVAEANRSFNTVYED